MHYHGRKHILEELRRVFDKAFSSIDILDAKLQGVLGLTSVLLPFVALVDFEKLKNFLGAKITWWVIVLLLVYSLIIITTFHALRPRDYYHPISNSWNELDEQYFGKAEDEILNQAISDYLAFNKLVQAGAKDKAIHLNITMVLLVIEVLIILGSIALPII